MKIEFDLSLDDMVAYAVHSSMHSRVVRRNYFVNLLLSIGAVVFTGLYAVWHAETPSRMAWELLGIWLGASFAIVLGLFGRRWFCQRLVRNLYSDGSEHAVVGSHRLSVTPECISEVTPLGEGTLKWRGVSRIDVTNEHIFIWGYSAVGGIIVPKSAFSTPAELDDFVSTAMDYFNSATATHH